MRADHVPQVAPVEPAVSQATRGPKLPVLLHLSRARPIKLSPLSTGRSGVMQINPYHAVGEIISALDLLEHALIRAGQRKPPGCYRASVAVNPCNLRQSLIIVDVPCDRADLACNVRLP